MIELATIETPRGTQVIYVPDHASNGGPITEESLLHRDCEQGFVTSVARDDGWLFCRFFYKVSVMGHSRSLRTLSSSEMAPVERLVVRDHRDQGEIDALFKALNI